MKDNYYHWMFDILPRFEILQRSGMVADYFVINSSLQFQRESLEILGIPPEKVINPSPNGHIEASMLIVPSLLGPVFRESPKSQACAYLRTAFLESCSARRAPHRLIYVSRDDASGRRVVNEDEVREVISAEGFEVVSLTNMPVIRQIELFSEARIVVGPHGAGFTNAVFCQPGSTLVELTSEEWKIDCFEKLAGIVGMKYWSVVAPRKDVKHPTGDFPVDTTALRNLLLEIAQNYDLSEGCVGGVGD